MERAELVSLLAAATGSLAPGHGVAAGELTEARRALAMSVLSGQTELPATERGGDVNSPAAETLPPDVLAEIQRVAEEAVGPKPGDRTRVVRREVPVLTSQIAESVPMRASGWAVERTFGPFLGADGRLFWLDVRRIVRHVTVVEAATGRTIGSFSHIGPLPNSSTIRIARGSVWWTAAPFDDASPAGSYFGVRVNGGVLRLSSPPLLAGGTVRVSPGTVIRLELAWTCRRIHRCLLPATVATRDEPRFDCHPRSLFRSPSEGWAN